MTEHGLAWISAAESEGQEDTFLGLMIAFWVMVTAFSLLAWDEPSQRDEEVLDVGWAHAEAAHACFLGFRNHCFVEDLVGSRQCPSSSH